MSLLAANLSALSTKSQRFVTRALATYLVTANEASAISFQLGRRSRGAGMYEPL